MRRHNGGILAVCRGQMHDKAMQPIVYAPAEILQLCAYFRLSLATRRSPTICSSCTRPTRIATVTTITSVWKRW